MKNYLIANFRLHHFKSLGYRKLANIRKSMQICKPFVQKNICFCLLPYFLGKITLPQPVKCSTCKVLNFKFLILQYLTQPNVHTIIQTGEGKPVNPTPQAGFAPASYCCFFAVLWWMFLSLFVIFPSIIFLSLLTALCLQSIFYFPLAFV